MSTAPVLNEAEDDVILNSLSHRQDIRLFPKEDVALAEVVVDGSWYYITHHAMERFIERADDTVRELFPHLDMRESSHALCALITLLKQGEYGTFSNKKNGGEAFMGAGWIFVIVREGLLNKVVTSYPKNKTTRFFAK